MKQGQKSQSSVRHQRSVGRYHSPYQRGGTIFQEPPYPWEMSNPYKYALEPPYQRGGSVRGPFNPFRSHTYDEMLPWIEKRMRQQRGGKVYPVVYPWTNKGRKRINRRRKQY